MLVSFSVTNYRSFGDEVTLNMVASNKLTDHPHHRIEIGRSGKFLLRSAVLYGANAAGKSNLVKAMAFAQQLISWKGNQMPVVESFRFDAEFPRKPSSFEFRFLIGDRIIVYGFDVTSRKIEAEWLTCSMDDQEAVIFERDSKGTTVGGQALENTFADDPQLAGLLKLLTQVAIKPHQLFLNRIASIPDTAQGKTLFNIIKWLTRDLEILTLDYRSCDLLKRLDRDDRLRKFSEDFLGKVDTGIRRLDFEERECNDWEKQVLTDSGISDEFPPLYGCESDSYCTRNPDNGRLLVRRLVATHPANGTDFVLPFSEESDGTQQLLHLLPIVSGRKDESKVVVVDELDKSLHPLLCWEFLRFFSESCRGARKQMIVTTHESQLLNQELLRRDEYWFVEKDKRQQSQLSTLSEFKIRNDLQIQKGYLQGRFGAIPVLGGLSELECLLDCQTLEDDDAQEETPA